MVASYACLNDIAVAISLLTFQRCLNLTAMVTSVLSEMANTIALVNRSFLPRPVSLLTHPFE